MRNELPMAVDSAPSRDEYWTGEFVDPNGSSLVFWSEDGGDSCLAPCEEDVALGDGLQGIRIIDPNDVHARAISLLADEMDSMPFGAFPDVDEQYVSTEEADIPFGSDILGGDDPDELFDLEDLVLRLEEANNGNGDGNDMMSGLWLNPGSVSGDVQKRVKQALFRKEVRRAKIERQVLRAFKERFGARDEEWEQIQREQALEAARNPVEPF